MTTLTQASHQWATRPADQRFASLTALRDAMQISKSASAAKVIKTSAMEVRPVDDGKGLVILGPNGKPVSPTHFSFGQLCSRVGVPAGYLRTLSPDLAADNLNYTLRKHEEEEIGVLLHKESGYPRLAAVTGPTYGRVWNADVAAALVNRFGDGITGQWTAPGEFGKKVEITKANTTFFGGDRTMFVFLADEKNKIEIPNRRDGASGLLSRGFFVWNSEVGCGTIGFAQFLFDYTCSNRMVWGVERHQEIRMRHTSGAPDRWLQEALPQIKQFAESSSEGVSSAITAAMKKKLGDKEKVAEFLNRRFTKSQARAIEAAHLADEHRPIATLWDAATGATAYARSITWQNERVEIEREAGRILALAA